MGAGAPAGARIGARTYERPGAGRTGRSRLSAQLSRSPTRVARSRGTFGHRCLLTAVATDGLWLGSG